MAFDTKELRISNIVNICSNDIYTIGIDREMRARPHHGLLYSFDAKILYKFESENIKVLPNSILYLPKNSYCEFEMIEAGRTVYIGFEFGDEIDIAPFLMQCRNVRRSSLLFQNAESDFERRGVTYKLLSDIYAIMATIERESTMQYVTRTEEQKINVAIKFIEENYINPKLSVGDIADSVALTTAVLRNKFSRFCSMSPMQYLTNTRMTEAKKLLRETQLTIVEISKAVGVEDSYYFSRIFKKHCSITPSEYRRQNRKRS